MTDMNINKKDDNKEVGLEKSTFWISFIILVIVCLGSIVYPSTALKYMTSWRSFVIHKFDWIFLTFGIVCLIGTFYVAFSKYGNVVLGGEDEKPDFSMSSWIGMIFCSAVGSNVILWAICEPLYYISAPPFGLEPFSRQAFDISLSYGLFHWGPIAWSFFALPTLAVAYYYLVRKNSNLKISAVCEEGLKLKETKGLKILDVLVVLATFGALAPSLGLGVPIISQLISRLFSIERTLMLDLIVLGIWATIFTTSVYHGLSKGIKILSDINVYLIYVILAFVLLFGGATTFILQNSVTSLGHMFQNFIVMATNTDPIFKSGFAQDWTVFYWAWYLAFAPFMMIFCAKVSRGRTIKEFLLGIMITGSIGTGVFFLILGSYTIHLQSSGILDIAAILAEHGTITTVIEIFASLPLSGIIMPLLIILYFVFLATCIDSGAYAMACVTSKSLQPGQDPSRRIRITWAMIIASLGIAMIRLEEGLAAIQALCIVLGFPVIIISIILFICQWNWFKSDFTTDKLGNLKRNPNIH